MTGAGAAARHLLARCESLERVDAYVFGSALHGVGADIDILIVGDDPGIFPTLKRELRAAGERLPLHVLFMVTSEERRFAFVARERCVPLRVVAATAA